MTQTLTTQQTKNILLGIKETLAAINQTLTTQQTKDFLLGIKEILQLVQSNPGYQNIINSGKFSTSNDLGICDAIQALSEIHQGILVWENSQPESIN
jgi:hypothetical protein